MANKVLSIEIGLNTTKICLTDYKAKNPKVYKYAKVATPVNAVSDGEVQAAEEFVSLLQSVIAENRMKCKQVLFTITSSKIANREIMIPKVKQNKINSMVELNAGDYFPVDLSQYRLGNIVLGTVNDNGTEKYRVLVLAVPVQLIESYQNLASALGMQLVALDYCGNSIYQVVKNECKTGTQMVVKIDEESSIVTVLKEQSIVLQRNIPYGINNAINAIMENRAFEIDNYDDALALAIRKSCINVSINSRNIIEYEDLDEAENVLLVEAKENVTASLESLVGGIARIIDYYGSRNNGESVDTIYVTGIGSEFSGISKLLTNELGIKSKGLKNIEGINLERFFDGKVFGEYVAPIGAAISPVEFIAAKKNGEKAKSGSRDISGLGYLILVTGIFAAGVLIALSIYNLSNAKKRYNDDVAKMNALQEIRVIYDKYTAVKTTYDQVQQLYAMTENHNEQILDFISELEDKLPANVRVSAFSSALENVTMSMEVNSKEEMASAIQTLRNFDSIETVLVTGYQDTKGEEGKETVSFTITCKYGSAEKAEN